MDEFELYNGAYAGPQIDEAIGKVLNPDATPTGGSTNLVTSGGVASAVSAVQNTVSRRNLLDNWYFVGGGSQQGGGQFPVNQRGNTSYSGAAYGIDRWKGANAYGNVAVQSDGLQINSIANAFFAIDQVIENGATNLNGKTVTLSVLLPNGDIAQGSATLNLTGTSQAVIQFFFSGSNGIAQVNASTSEVSVRLRVQNNLTVKVAAVKLEVGSVSTLANDAPPCFAEELAKCQRYLQPVLFGGYDGGGLTNCVARWINSGFQVLAQVRLSPQMRAAPSTLVNTLSGAGRVVILDCSAGTVAGTPTTTGFSLNSNPSPVSCYIYATTGSAQSMVDNGKYQYEIDAIGTTGTLLVSAEP